MGNSKKTIEVKDPETGLTYVFSLLSLNVNVAGQVSVQAFKNRGAENEKELPAHNHYENVNIASDASNEETFQKLIADHPFTKEFVTQILNESVKRYIDQGA
jgi:hypothetical protein